MLNPLMIGVSYAILFSLLLSLNFFTKFSTKVKIFFTILSLLFFIMSYTSVREMQGRPYKDNHLTKDNKPYKILWHGVNEPDKINNTKGKIYLLLQPVDNKGFIKDEPRLLEIFFNPLIYEKITEIEKITKNGTPLAVRFTNLEIKPFDGDLPEDLQRDADRYNNLSGEIGIEFEEINGISLPKK